MPKLTSSESTALSYLAEYPNAPDAKDVADRLSGAARQIADVIIGRAQGNESESIKKAAETLLQWAKRGGFRSK